MKIEIDSDGYLLLERAGVMKHQTCFIRFAICGDWCPQFGEPQPSEVDGYKTVIILCQGARWFCNDFSDQRGKLAD